jgi:hypothetical protein
MVRLDWRHRSDALPCMRHRLINAESEAVVSHPIDFHSPQEA